MKNKIFIALLAVFVIGAGLLASRFLLGGSEDTWICENDQWVAHGSPSSTPPTEGCGEQTNENETIVGGDRDEHGCIGSAGYSWCENKQKCLRVWEESCYPDIEQQIKDALVEKNSWDPDEIRVTVAKNDGTYATGGARGDSPQGGGGIWFAKKVDDNWEIVWDGNGVVMCDDLLGYEDFPTDLIPQCYNQQSGEMVVR